MYFTALKRALKNAATHDARHTSINTGVVR